MVARQRSPNYPGLDLGAAIEASQSIYQLVQRGEFTLSDAARAWGYNSASGPVRVRLAALRQYNLIDGKRGENPRLSRQALTFILRNPASREYSLALAEAALAPPLFNELHSLKGSASDSALKEFLILDRNFTDEGADRFVDTYKATLRLANLDSNDRISGLEEDIEDIFEGESDVLLPSVLSPPLLQGSITIPVPFSPGKIGTVTLPTDMTKEDWDRFDRIIEGYRPLEGASKGSSEEPQREAVDRTGHETPDVSHPPLPSN